MTNEERWFIRKSQATNIWKQEDDERDILRKYQKGMLIEIALREPNLLLHHTGNKTVHGLLRKALTKLCNNFFVVRKWWLQFVLSLLGVTLCIWEEVAFYCPALWIANARAHKTLEWAAKYKRPHNLKCISFAAIFYIQENQSKQCTLLCNQNCVYKFGQYKYTKYKYTKYKYR